MTTGEAPAPPGPPQSGVELWAKRLSSGNAHAVVLVNLDVNATDYTLKFASLGAPSGTKAAVRDLWARQDLGDHTDTFLAKAIEGHGNMMLTVTFDGL